MRIYEINTVEEFQTLNILSRSENIVFEKRSYVQEIVDNIKTRKDEALLEFTLKFDGINLRKEDIKVTQQEIQEAFEVVEKPFIDAILYAIGNVEKYHALQLPKQLDIEVDEGIQLGRRWSPIETVGLYIPGGRAPYVTACYMLGVPAKVAGCKHRIACVPPDKETGKVNPYVLVSASLAGITSIYKVGGAQAIAAMAYGTETIPKVGKIFGPGNVYVTAAKLLVYGKVDIDAPAGPSEALIIADDSIEVEYVASDLISQAEHDVNSAAVFLTTSKQYAEDVMAEVTKQMQTLKRKDTIMESLKKYGLVIVCPSIETCIQIANVYAPEHIQIMTRNDELYVDQIVNAGSVCIGKYSPIAMGDYVSGVNNVIPTGGGTKAFSPVHVESFMKCFETQKISRQGLQIAKESLKAICDVEGFGAHLNSVAIRLK